MIEHSLPSPFQITAQSPSHTPPAQTMQASSCIYPFPIPPFPHAPEKAGWFPLHNEKPGKLPSPLPPFHRSPPPLPLTRQSPSSWLPFRRRRMQLSSPSL